MHLKSKSYNCSINDNKFINNAVNEAIFYIDSQYSQNMDISPKFLRKYYHKQQGFRQMSGDFSCILKRFPEICVTLQHIP